MELGAQVRREALRLRVRWLQELLGHAAFELGRRLVDRGELHRAEDVRMLRLAELSAVVAHQACTLSDRCRERSLSSAEAEVPQLPARFRLGDRGRPIPVRSTGQSGGGTGAGGGTAVGVVTRDQDDPPDGSVLVVGSLRPGLGPLLPKLSGIVSETGSVLSHLAILARESGVATVVGHAGALEELAEGATVTVDGQSGEVTVQDGDGTRSGHESKNRTKEEQS